MTPERMEWTKRLFQSIDNRDIDAFTGFLAADVSFSFGNAAPVKKRAAVRDVVSGFFGSIEAVSHRLDRIWDVSDAVICHGDVTYTRHDASTLTVPFANILNLRDDLIESYRIYVDISELYRTA